LLWLPSLHSAARAAGLEPEAVAARAVDETGVPERLPLLATAAVGMQPLDAVAWLSDVLHTNVRDGYRHHAQIAEAIEAYFT